MLVQLIRDAEGPNPEFCPPSPSEDPNGFQAYCVPNTIMIPAGTILPDSPLAWVHCFPKSQHYVDPRTRKPTRVSALGEVIAIPADDQCRAAFEKNLPAWCAAHRLTLDQGRVKIQELVSRAAATSAGAAAPAAARQESNV